MKVKEVFAKYRKLVPFPWNKKKIRCSGMDPKQFVKDFAKDLTACEDQTADTLLFCKKVKALK